MIENTRCILVVLDVYDRKIPQVLEDYIYSLNIVDEVINLSELDTHLATHKNTCYILTQMILSEEFFKANLGSNMLQSSRIIFLNVEMLTESTRMQQMVNIIKYTKFRIADYSIENLNILVQYLFVNNITYFNQLIHLPYQFNLKENMQLINTDNEYDYDIGIVNALPEKSDTVDSSLTYRRTVIWEKLNEQYPNLRLINILGWGNERDTLIKKCKVIVNVHHFECYNIHESIRCDRLIFANKIIVSDTSIHMNLLDMRDFIYTVSFDNIINTAQTAVTAFDSFMEFNKIKQNGLIKVIADRKTALVDQCSKMVRTDYAYRHLIFNEIIKGDNYSYLEIGVETGITFNKVNTINKIGVDPSPRCNFPNIIRLTSDDFFKTNTKKFDVIFIDGMHQVEYILRDFNNSVNALNANGVLFMDDIFPLNEEEQLKIPKHHMYEDGVLKYSTNDPWTGDGWKLFYYLLLNYRKHISWTIYLSRGYRGVAKIELKQLITIPEDKLHKINSYTYANDFCSYSKLLLLSSK